MENIRFTAILQVFSLILVMKSISATYFATKYAMQNQLWIVEKYTKTLSLIPFFLIIPLILISIPLISKRINKKIQNYLDYVSIALIILSIGIIFI